MYVYVHMADMQSPKPDEEKQHCMGGFLFIYLFACAEKPREYDISLIRLLRWAIDHSRSPEVSRALVQRSVSS
jgi:hypothetical protein